LPLIYLTDHIPISWRPYYSIQFPAKIIGDLPISDRPAEALAILTLENHKEMSMKVIILFYYFINNSFKFDFKDY